MKKLTLLLFLALPICVLAQRAQTIKGIVVDGETKQPLVGATVFVQLDELIGASTDIDGKFKLEDVPVARIEVKCT